MDDLSQGQQDALRDLKALQQASDYSIEFISQQLGAVGTLIVEISIDCRGFDYRMPGLRLRDRERFMIAISAEFPLEPPDVFAPDHRFAFHDHVYWADALGVFLCLYYSTEQQWQPAQGIAGFLWRLMQWLERASVGELDAPGHPRHPPLAHGAEDDNFFVIRKDCPKFKCWWPGYAVLEKTGSHRFDIVEWTDDMQRHKRDILAPAILLNVPFVSEFPQFVGSLMILLRRAGVDEDVLAHRRRIAAIVAAKLGVRLLSKLGGRKHHSYRCMRCWSCLARQYDHGLDFSRLDGNLLFDPIRKPLANSAIRFSLRKAAYWRILGRCPITERTSHRPNTCVHRSIGGVQHGDVNDHLSFLALVFPAGPRATESEWAVRESNPQPMD